MGERERERERNSQTDEDRIYIARKQRETERKIRNGRQREMLLKASFLGLFSTNFAGHFRKLFLFTKFDFSNWQKFLNFTKFALVSNFSVLF